MVIKHLPVLDYSEQETYQILTYTDFTIGFIWTHFNESN
jgi:hypothetical protein